MEVVYIYSLKHPETKEIRYIGKANNLKKRLKGHMVDSKTRRTPLYSWINKLKSQGLEPIIEVIRETDINGWMDAEKDEIRTYIENGYRLLNIAEGGNEPYCSKEVRAENGRKNAMAIHSDQKRKHLWSLKHQLGLDLRYLEAKGDDRQKEKCAQIRSKLATRRIYLKQA